MHLFAFLTHTHCYTILKHVKPSFVRMKYFISGFILSYPYKTNLSLRNYNTIRHPRFDTL